MNNYCVSRFNCVKAPVRTVKVGDVEIGGGEIVVQSMTNTKTCDVEASVRQCIQLAEAGCRIVRLTAQNLEAARALGDISKSSGPPDFQRPSSPTYTFCRQPRWRPSSTSRKSA